MQKQKHMHGDKQVQTIIYILTSAIILIAPTDNKNIPIMPLAAAASGLDYFTLSTFISENLLGLLMVRKPNSFLGT